MGCGANANINGSDSLQAEEFDADKHSIFSSSTVMNGAVKRLLNNDRAHEDVSPLNQSSVLLEQNGRAWVRLPTSGA